MHNPVVIALVLIAIGLIILMLREGLSRKVDFFTSRNMYFVGFIIYQLVSPAVALQTENYTFFRVDSPNETGKKFLLMAVFFLAVFMFSYRKIKLTPWIARKFTVPPREMSDFLLLGLAIFLVVSGMFLRFTPFTVLTGPAAQVSIAFAAIAAAIAGWVWSNRRANIPVVLMAAGIVFGCLVIVLTGAFGRRPLLVVAMGLAWGVYHRRARLMSPARMLVYISPFVLAAAVAVAAFTAIRGREVRTMDVHGTIASMQGADVQSGMKNLLGGQTTGSASLWAIEQWPDRFEQRFLFSLKYMGMYFVPRMIWPDKPLPLGNEIASLADVKGVNQTAITIPPGVIGYSVAEGGYVALFLYAIFFGQFMRLVDELVRLNPTNSFIILPAAVATGQAFGLARGCIAVFSDLLVLGFISTYLILFIADRLFGRKITQVQYSPMPQLRLVSHLMISGKNADKVVRVVASGSSDRMPMHKPLRIVHFFPRIRREEGGVVQVILDLCQMMTRTGHQVILATCDATDVPADWLSGQGNPRAVQLERSALMRGRLSHRGLEQFESLLGEVDVVHLHTPWELSNLQLAALLKKRGLPYIVTVHGMLDDYSMRQKGLKKRAFLALGGRSLFRNATTVHFTAAAEKEQAEPWIPGNYLPMVQACAIDFTPYAVLPGPELARDAFPQLAHHRQKILFLSRLHPKKGVDLLLQAAALLQPQGVQFELLIAGPGEEDYVEQLKELAARLGVQSITHFLGMVRGELKLSLYQLADVFVLPTHQENFGLVLPEALACGTPVVTTRGTDIWRELADAGALIVNENSPAELASAIAKLLADQDLRTQLGNQGRKYVNNWLAEDKVQAGYEQMYRDTIQRAARMEIL